jgi:hypothetical protein
MIFGLDKKKILFAILIGMVVTIPASVFFVPKISVAPEVKTITTIATPAPVYVQPTQSSNLSFNASYSLPLLPADIFPILGNPYFMFLFYVFTSYIIVQQMGIKPMGIRSHDTFLYILIGVSIFLVMWFMGWF